MVRPRARRLLGALFASGVALPGCALVLGIEEAREDPSLTPAAHGAGGGGSASEEGSKGGATTDGTGGSTSTASSASNGGGGESGAKGVTPCDEYCDEIVDNCDPAGTAQPPLRQYADVGQCLAACRLFAVGEPGDRGVNTVECRLTRARSAQSEPTDCNVAGPYPGSDGCGTVCEAYCTLMMGACNVHSTGEPEGYYFEDWQSCMAACALVPDTQAYVFHPDTNVITGNHMACRIYHALVATEGDIEHCDHAMGGSLCVPE
jgi:hypothetical protein